MTKVVILDTGCCNLTSLRAAICRLGVDPVVTSKASVAQGASRLFVPGVGTAKAAMRELKARGLIETIQMASCPVLGICLGMQLLGQESEETGGVQTLGLIHGQVRQLKTGGRPLPHMGWNRVKVSVTDPLFSGLDKNLGEYFYFVHSFAFAVCDATIATSTYGETFSAAVRKKNFWGVQFHPERSGAAGVRLLKNFLERT